MPSTPVHHRARPGNQTLTATAPAAGLREIELGLTVTGHEFTQSVNGTLIEPTG